MSPLPHREEAKQTSCRPRGLIGLMRSYYIIPTLLIFINLISTVDLYYIPLQMNRCFPTHTLIYLSHMVFNQNNIKLEYTIPFLVQLIFTYMRILQNIHCMYV